MAPRAELRRSFLIGQIMSHFNSDCFRLAGAKIRALLSPLRTKCVKIFHIDYMENCFLQYLLIRVCYFSLVVKNLNQTSF